MKVNTKEGEEQLIFSGCGEEFNRLCARSDEEFHIFNELDDAGIVMALPLYEEIKTVEQNNVETDKIAEQQSIEKGRDRFSSSHLHSTNHYPS